MKDAIIVGAGPAGSSLAIRLARRGWKVLLVERGAFPKQKVCGEGVMPAGVAALAELGIHPPGLPFEGVRYHGSHVAAGSFEGASGLGVRRWHLDQHLFAAAASEPGVEVRLNTNVAGPLMQSGVIADGHELRAGVTIAADGANSRLRHALGWDAGLPSDRLALRQHFETREAFRWVDIYLLTHGEIYVTPVGQGIVSVALLTGKGRHSLAESIPPALRERLGKPIDEVQGAAPLTVRATCRVAPGIVLLGDAAGNCDPITGGGISQALVAARLLADHLDRGADLTQFDREREAMLRDYRRLTSMVLALARHPRWQSAALSALRAAPKAFTHLLGVAGGTRTLWGGRLAA